MKGLTFSHKTNVCLFVAQLCLTLCSPMKHSPQAPLFMGFSRQECWSGLPFPSPGDLPNPEIEPGSPTLQADSLLSELSGTYMQNIRTECLSSGRLYYRREDNAAAKSLQSCPTLCDPIDGSPPGSAVPGILQARTLEWVAISFSSAWKWKWSCSVVSNS